MKFISLVPFEQLKSPKAFGPFRWVAPLNPVAARSSACAQEAG
jgi:hypothetical protein